MSQKLNIAIKGIMSNNNQLQVGDGALVNAANIVIDRGVAESRRGFGRFTADPLVDAINEYQNKLIIHRTDDTLAYYDSGWTNYSGTYEHPDGKIKFLQVNQNLYFVTADGVKVLDAYNGAVYNTGMPQGLDGSGSTTGASGFMADDSQVAYRVVWGSRDANNNLYLGAPSQRIIVANTSGGTRDVSLTITIPSGITVNEFFQVYRSKGSATAADEPSDELQLIYEANPTAGEVTAKSLTFTDVTADSLRGAALYTNSSQEGIQESNFEPPFAKDIALFKGFTFYANIKTKQALNIKLLAVDGSGLVVNDTITVNGMVFTAKAATNVASREFKVFTTGSVAQNIDDTARELIKVINQYTSNTTVYAYYTTQFDDLPGQIKIEARTLAGAQFTVTASNSVAWDLDDGSSDNEEFANGLMWGKAQQPEHVPAAHRELIGSKSYPIRRILALQDSLFIFKDDGIFRITGQNGSWSVDQTDASTILIAPETAVVLNNSIYGLTNQGVVSVSSVGVQVVSEDIKDKLTELIGVDYDSLKTTSFAVGYETDRKYILYTLSAFGETIPTQAWILNVFTGKWSRWEKEARCGFVRPSVDKLYTADDVNFLEERKSFTYRDFVDEELDGYEVVDYLGAVVTLNTVLGLTVGDLLYYDADVFSPIISIDEAAGTVTVDADNLIWPSGPVTVYKAIDCKIEWAAQYCDNSGLEKHFQEMILILKQKRFNIASMEYFTDVSGSWEPVVLEGDFGGGDWGLFNWGTIPWGGEARGSKIRMSVPRNKARGQYLSARFVCRHAYSLFQIQGLSLQFDWTSERVDNGVTNG